MINNIIWVNILIVNVCHNKQLKFTRDDNQPGPFKCYMIIIIISMLDLTICNLYSYLYNYYH